MLGHRQTPKHTELLLATCYLLLATCYLLLVEEEDRREKLPSQEITSLFCSSPGDSEAILAEVLRLTIASPARTSSISKY